GVNFTADIFDIRLKNRLSVSQHYTLTDSQKAQLIKEGVTSAANLETFQFFINDFNTSTQGLDFVATAPISNGTLIAVYNFTSTEVTHIVIDGELVELTEEFDDPDYEEWKKATLDAHRTRELEENLPKHRASLTLAQSITDAWGVIGRANYFSGWFDSEDYLQNPKVEGTGEYTGKFTVDLETTYTVASGLALTLGGRNILNTYPDENPNGADSVGNKYGQFSPFGFDGAYWYAKVGYSF
ncbi:MAG: TonB-dependent receptor, partial [Candidatus Poribacteria bacterium]|nr:TonB-dependent receptor [Candidatus Poribacteria bacterium]